MYRDERVSTRKGRKRNRGKRDIMNSGLTFRRFLDELNTDPLENERNEHRLPGQSPEAG